MLPATVTNRSATDGAAIPPPSLGGTTFGSIAATLFTIVELVASTATSANRPPP
ncbi:MAG: hypothetical protein U0W40_13935 [Acidimicrobiia bacterium]